MKLWPFKRFLPIEEKATSGTSAPDQWLLDLLSGGSTSGLAVSTADALSVPAVSSAIRVISEAAASLDIKVEAKGENGKWVETPHHRVRQLLTGGVNDWLSGFEFIRDLTAQALIHDNGGLAYVNRANGSVAEVIHYDQGNISYERSSEGTGEPIYKLGGKVVPARDVIHLRGPFTRSPLNMAKDAIGTAKTMEAHAGGLFKNGAKPAGIIEFPNKLGDEALKAMRAAWTAAHEGSANAGKTAILWDGASFKPITLTSTDAQFLELRTFQNIEIARAFRVPPSMLFEMERVTWSNGEQMGKEFLTYCLEPWLRSLEAALRRGLFLGEERQTHRVRFDRDDLTRADLNSRATAISSLIASRVLNPNDGRSWLDLEPYEGGEQFANPNTGSSQPGNGNTDNSPQPQARMFSRNNAAVFGKAG